ncbi:MAG: mechanosensitive ion channel family protein [Acidobacteriota bacterium]
MSAPFSVPSGLFNIQDPVSEGPMNPAEMMIEWLPAWTPQPVTLAAQKCADQPALLALLIALFFFLAGKAAQLILCRGISRLTARTSTEVDDKLLVLVRRPVFLSVFLLGLALAVHSLSFSLGLDGAVPERTEDLLLTVVIFSWLGALLPGLRLVLDALGRHRDSFPLIEERTIPLFDIFSKLVVVGGAGFLIFEVWDFDPTPVFTSAGIIGIAVGFAARDTLANLFAGIFIVADSPYKLGDFITLDSGERGLVTHVGIRSTRLLTRDDIEVTLPNSVIGNAKILNESGGRWEKERIRVKVGVAYGSDVDRVCELLVELAVTHDHICPEPRPRVRMRGFGDSSLDFELLCWIDEPVLRGRLSHELYMDVYKAFGREGIEIPFPQRDVWVRQVAAAEGASPAAED